MTIFKNKDIMNPEDCNLTDWLTEAEIEQLNSIIPKKRKNKSNTFTVIRASTFGLMKRKIEDKIKAKLRIKLNNGYQQKARKVIMFSCPIELYEGFKQLCGNRQVSATMRALMVRYIEEKTQ